MADLDELEKAYQLLQGGIITQADFEAIKNETLTPKPSYKKSRICAGLLALFLGGVGAHKFYLGYTTQAIILLSINVFALIVTFAIPYLAPILGLVSTAITIVCIIEAIMYFTKTDAEFNTIYVENSKYWF